MTLDEVRAQIDAVDAQMKPLFLERMKYAAKVVEAKIEMGSDSVFVPERELAIIRERAADVTPEFYDEYVIFLRHLMSVSRRYQYGILKELQDTELKAQLARAGLDENADHQQIEIGFSCHKETGRLNVFLDMAALNKIPIDQVKIESKDGKQSVYMVLDGNIKDSNMRRFLCQIAKESEGFAIVELR